MNLTCCVVNYAMNAPFWDLLYSTCPSVCGTVCCMGYVTEGAAGEGVVAAASNATKSIFSALTKLV
jgi:hypothetical protein